MVRPSFSFRTAFIKTLLVCEVRFNQTRCTPGPPLLLYTHLSNDYGLTQADLVRSPEDCSFMQMSVGLALYILASAFSSGPQRAGSSLKFSRFSFTSQPNLSLPFVLTAYRTLVWCYFVLQCSCQDDPLEQALMAAPYEDIFFPPLHEALLETVILHLVGFSCRFAIPSSESCSAESAQGDAFPKRKRTYLHRKPIQFLIYITYLRRYFHIGQARVLLHHAFTPPPPHKALNECSEG